MLGGSCASTERIRTDLCSTRSRTFLAIRGCLSCHKGHRTSLGFGRYGRVYVRTRIGVGGNSVVSSKTCLLVQRNALLKAECGDEKRKESVGPGTA